MVLVKPYVLLRADAAARLAWLEVVETPAAVADPDLPDARPLPGEPGADRDTQVDAPGPGVVSAGGGQRGVAAGAAASKRLAIASSRWCLTPPTLEDKFLRNRRKPCSSGIDTVP